MPLEIVRNDITKMQTDAIVNAASVFLLGGTGVDGAIHKAAGPELLAECRTLGGCEVGSVKVTAAYRLPCKYIIHAAVPRWQGGKAGEREKLTSCYKAALEAAKEKKCESVAFPLLSSGRFAYPKYEALQVAVTAIADFLFANEMMVYLVVFDKGSYLSGKKLFKDIAEFIDDNYAEERFEEEYAGLIKLYSVGTHRSRRSYLPGDAARWDESARPKEGESGGQERGESSSLAAAVGRLDESFSQMLLRKIDERGLTDAQCYKKANISRQLFSKIRSDRYYRPGKPTVLAFAVALELSLEETKELLLKAGFALSHSNKFDIIAEYFISRGNYNIYEINEALFAFDQALLGG